ncbi:MAG: DUF192 domain-containing protein [Candidatus Gottesmanbacteria bacterium]
MSFKFKISLLSLIGIIGLLWGVSFLRTHSDKKPFLTINKQKIFLEVAKTAEEHERGLSYRENIPINQGMLFIFAKSGNYSFWMKDMKFDLDFIYINGSIIVDVVENVPYPKSSEQPKIIVAKHEFDKVLEVNSGTINRLKIKIGDKAEYSFD